MNHVLLIHTQITVGGAADASDKLKLGDRILAVSHRFTTILCCVCNAIWQLCAAR